MTLEAIYRAAIYRVDAPGGAVDLRVEETSPALAALVGDEAWIFITAWNPGSQERDRASNEEAQRALEADLRSRGARVVPGEGLAADGSWREPSFLAIGLGEQDGLELARAHGQRAILCGRGGGPVRLVFT